LEKNARLSSKQNTEKAEVQGKAKGGEEGEGRVQGVRSIPRILEAGGPKIENRDRLRLKERGEDGKTDRGNALGGKELKRGERGSFKETSEEGEPISTRAPGDEPEDSELTS